MYYRVWVASQRFHGKESLTYSSKEKLASGQIVAVPLQRQKVTGIVASFDRKPKFATKAIVMSWPFVVPAESVKLMSWLAHYYPAPQGIITELFTPPALTNKTDAPKTIQPQTHLPELAPLTSEQQSAVDEIINNPRKSIILHGDTGSGKTRVYVELAQRAFSADKSAIILTPEIGLTEQLRETFSLIFGGQVVVTHSEMTPAQRRKIWQLIAASDKPLIVIGPRSAIFSPLKNIGLIVMDEAHDGAYKQEQAPYYQTSRLAARLAHLHGANLIMGTATPLISDYFTFQQKDLPIIRMTQQALPSKSETAIVITDHRDKSLFNRSAWLSDTLLSAIDQSLDRHEQSMLFLNRRGSARLVHCINCGWQAMCPHCDVALTYHQDHHIMRCHSCNFSGKTPTACPECGAAELIFRSIGTKALEGEVGRLYPNARVARFDRDTEKSLRLTNQYQALRSGKIDILIGTQTIAKGFDLPKLGVVGIVQADSGLQIPDFTSNERTYQLISQVSGRIGRGHIPGKLIIQSFQPNSPLIKYAVTRDYTSFFQAELAERQLFHFPPYFFLLKVSCSRASSASAQNACSKIAAQIISKFPGAIIEGPAPRFTEKISGRYAWHLIIKSVSRSQLLSVIDLLPTNCSYDIDPSDLL